MPRIVPSTIRDFIEREFPESIGSPKKGVSYQRVGPLRTLVRLLDELDDSLTPPAQDDYLRFLVARDSIQTHLTRWELHGGHHTGVDVPANYILILHECLSRCLDMAAPSDVVGLEFIGDPAYRERLRDDIGAAEFSFNNGQFKFATVMAGSVLEALLLAEIEKSDSSQRAAAIRGARLQKVLDKGLESATLEELIKIARKMELLSEDTLKAADLARNFRDLIHPGRVKREQAECNRATGHSALAAMYHVIEECQTKRIRGTSDAGRPAGNIEEA